MDESYIYHNLYKLMSMMPFCCIDECGACGMNPHICEKCGIKNMHKKEDCYHIQSYQEVVTSLKKYVRDVINAFPNELANGNRAMLLNLIILNSPYQGYEFSNTAIKRCINSEENDFVKKAKLH